MRSRVAAWWDRYEGPTFVVAGILYGSWGLLVWNHARLPWWLMLGAGAYLVAWHGSLQHETIDALVRVPQPIRTALAAIPLGLWLPYPVYHRTHRKHHRTRALTDAVDDPESYYHRAEAWRRYHPFLRAVLLLNQTLVGRLTIGPLLQIIALAMREARDIAQGDRNTLRDWCVHALTVGALFWWISGIAGMPWWEYVALIAYPGASLGMLRSFTEHRYAEAANARTAVVESALPFALLFLNNNLHVSHHRAPTLPWYKLPHVWAQRREYHAHEADVMIFAGYREIARRWMFRPVFVPVERDET